MEEVSRARFRDPAAGELDADHVEGLHRDGEDQTEVVGAGVAVQRVVRDEPAEEEGEVLHGRRLVPPLLTADDDALPLGDISHHVAKGPLDVVVEVNEVEGCHLFKPERDALEKIDGRVP